MTNPGYSNLLEEALEGWGGVRAGVISEVENLPEERFDERPAEGFRTVRELVDHIVESSFLLKELVRDDGDFTRASFPELVAEHAGDLAYGGSKDEQLVRLRETHRALDAAIRQAGELHMLQHIHRFDGLRGTRLAWFQHSVQHEYYHCGQLALIARVMGVVPALTQRIRGG